MLTMAMANGLVSLGLVMLMRGGVVAFGQGLMAALGGYTAALVLEGQRIRGIDYSHIERKRFYKKYIQKGWHENIIDPNLRPPDDNRHPPLDNFQPTDLTHFRQLVAQKWNIVLPTGDLLI
jgi:ABC-type branched-subunit amino acid transport system permease subunit